MRNERQYRHYHEKSPRWFREEIIDYTIGSDKDRDVHHHMVVDEASGATGEGFGWSYRQAERRAWDDLKNRQPGAAKLMDLG